MEMRAAAYSEGNVSLKIVSAKDNSNVQKEQIQAFIDEGVDLLVVAPNQYNSITTVLDKAYDKGIPVILIDRKADSPKYTAFIGTDNYEIGRTIGSYMAGKLGGKGIVLEIKGLNSSSPAVERHRGFADAIAAFPGISTVDGGDTDWTEESAITVTEAFAGRNPGFKADAVFGHNDRIASGARKILGDDGGIYVGVDALPSDDGGVKMVIDGKLDATYIYPTRGDLVVALAMQVLNNEPFEKDTYLSSALITSDNAAIMLTQMDEVRDMQDRIMGINSQIDVFLKQYNTQRLLLIMSVIVVLLILFLAAYIYRNELRRHNRAVAEANERLRFFTNVSHEIRTPLTLIADPLARISETETLSGKGRKMLELVNRQVEVLLNLVSQILDIRKIQNQKMSVSMAETDIAACVRRCCESFIPHASARGIGVKTYIPEHLRVMTDEGKIERIAYNLVSNAIKYSPEGCCIGITLASDKSEGSFSISVSDQGKGIKPKDLKKIFQRFYQVTDSVSGTGIGLALVQDMVKLMKGDIKVESEPGKTEFKVILPSEIIGCEDTAVHENIVLESSAPRRTAVYNALDGEQVLVVDDNADVRSYLHDLLGDAGYGVLEAANGTEAMQTATENIPDIVISDVMMPGTNGHALCQKLKEQTVTSHIPVILITASAMEEDRAKGYESGADAYISKPFTSRIILSRIRNLIDGRKHLKDIFSYTVQAQEPAPQTENILPQAENKFVSLFRQKVEEKMCESNFSVETLAAELNMSRVQLYRKIKALTGQNPVELVRDARLAKADWLLKNEGANVSEAAYSVGFSSPSYFIKCYKERYGKTPKENLTA